MHSGFNALGLKILFHGQFNMVVIVVVQIAEDCPATISSNNTTKVQ